jgi:guanidinoacetate N-methyltransferase
MRPDSGWHTLPSQRNKSVLAVGEHKVMKRWETPLMKRMAVNLCAHLKRTRVMEVGFGMGISASALQSIGVERHTIVEPHPDMFGKLQAWRHRRPSADIRPVHDYWQNRVDLMSECDGIFFDTYASSLPSLIRENLRFLGEASKRLKPGAAVTMFWIMPTIDKAQQLALYTRFSRVVIERVPVRSDRTTPSPDEPGFLLSILAIK